MGRPERAAEHLEICRKIIAAGEDWKGRAGLVDRAEGILAAAEGRPFANHFEKAIAVFKRYSSPSEQAETLVSWGRALLCDDNRKDAAAMFDAAIAIHRRCGVGDGYLKFIEKRRTAFPRRTINPSIPPKSLSTFRREGDFWIVAHNGNTSRLRNIKGLVYVAHLLERPGERVHVIDLVQAIEGSADTTRDGTDARAQGLAVQHGLGDAGELLDAQALDEYRGRQSELRAELEAAQRDNDPRRAEAARHELELITDEISSAVGQYGRGRKAQAHSERASSLVTKHIRSAIDLVRRNDPQLATHFDRSIQTGAHCAYLPESREKIDWQT